VSLLAASLLDDSSVIYLFLPTLAIAESLCRFYRRVKSPAAGDTNLIIPGEAELRSRLRSFTGSNDDARASLVLISVR